MAVITGDKMPSYASLQYHDIPCPSCGAALKCVFEPKPCYITFQWGYCIGTTAYSTKVYQVGDEIYWRPCRDGIVRGETSFDGGQNGFNVGDLALANVIVLDVGVGHFPQWCSVCGQAIGGAALHIENNVIKSAWAFLHGQITPDIPAVYYTQRDGEMVDLPASEAAPWQAIKVYVKQDDGTWKPMREWEFGGPSYFDTENAG